MVGLVDTNGPRVHWVVLEMMSAIIEVRQSPVRVVSEDLQSAAFAGWAAVPDKRITVDVFEFLNDRGVF